MKYLQIWGLTLLFFLMSVRGVKLQEMNRVLSNEQLIQEKLVSPVIREIENRVPGGQNLIFKIRAETDLKNWLLTQLTDSLISRPYTIYQKENSDRSYYQINLEVRQLKFVYRKGKRRLIFWTDNYERRFRYIFHMTILAPDGRVLGSHLFKNTYSDIIPAGKWNTIENAQIPFTRGTKQPTSRFKRVIEPVILTGATMTIVYLFYTLRSGK